NEDDENDVRQCAQESLAPYPKTLLPNVSGVVNDRQTADNVIASMQRQGINVDRCNSDPQEGIGVVVVLERLQHDCGRARHQWLNACCDGNRMALQIVDRQPRQMFPVGELLDGSLQSTLGVAFQITLHISGETLSQHLG